ncbi:MerC domain-containing protein [Sphingomonas sp. Mn802worker]|uniref:MerC domain-containing protein n=1 Tax=Sphingomonas sp. Mn802worker TaxID=629773 RepID=UPI0004771740|nr:MerC domain-containing protein [Sphingomonas sp. Mn802worker]
MAQQTTSTDAAAAGASRLDRWAIGLSAACLVHCVATTVMVAVLSTAGGLLGNPIIHEVGLVLAILIGAVAFGKGVMAHGRPLPLLLGGAGLAMMAAAVIAPHGVHHLAETALTIVGVVVLATGHALNRHRHA